MDYTNDELSAAFDMGMREDGQAKWNQRHLEAGTDVANRKPEWSQLANALEEVADGLKADIEEARKSKGRIPDWVCDLERVSPYTLALIGLQCCYNSSLSRHRQNSSGPKGYGDTVSKTIANIGKLIDNELLSIDLLLNQSEAVAKDTKRIIKMTSVTNSSPDQRLKALRIISTKNNTQSLYFNIKNKKGDQRKTLMRRKSNAGPVLNAVVKHCDLFEKLTVRDSTKNTRSLIELTDIAVTELEKSTEAMSWTQPMFKPLVGLPPKPWTSFDTGCYHDPRLASGISLVRRAKNKQKQAIEHQLTNGLPVYVRALNALQATPLSINQPILEAVQWTWGQRHSFGKFPAQDLPEFPRLPADHETMDVNLKAAIKEDQREFFKTKTELQGTTNVMKQDLQVAVELSDYDQFWIPWNLDYRGRFNPVCNFNYHRADHIKALFEFNRGYRIEGNNAYWLQVHVANCGDFEKASKKPLDQRVQWVEDNKEWLMEIAGDYRAHCDRWQSADHPFQFLAAVFELKRYYEEGEAFVGYVPIGLDGTNSGAQHYSALSLSSEGRLVNLVPSSEMQDVYKEASVVVKGELEKQLANKDVFGNGALSVGAIAQVWLDYGVDRSLLKRPCMVYPYSSRASGMAQQFVEDVITPLQKLVNYKKLKTHPIGPTSIERRLAARLLGTVCYASIEQVLPGAAACMKWLQANIKVLSDDGKPTCWTTPSGFTAVQSYAVRKPLEAKIFLHDRKVGIRTRTKVTFSLDSEKVDVRASVRSGPANFIHSLDASHMASTIVHLSEQAEDPVQDFFMIHDSFAIAGDTWELFDAVRHTFVEQYDNGCLLERFQEEVRQQLSDPTLLDDPKKGVGPIPAKGDLDLQGIKRSEFCFS
jgi:DNA-directed RNA polymerase